MPALLQDLRFAVRLFARTPGVTLVAVLSLALGIGANAAIFSAVDALGFRSLAVQEEGRLVRVFGTDRRSSRGRVSYEEFREVRDQAQSFTGVMVHGLRAVAVTDPGGDTSIVAADVVSGDYFTTLGIQPAIGRPFRPAEEFPGAAPAVVISHSLWQSRFGADPGAVGKPIRISSTTCTLAGVMKTEFRGTQGLQAPDVWVPVETWAQLGSGRNRKDFEDRSRWLDMTGRLRAGVSPREAASEVAAIGARLALSWPGTNRERGMTAVPETEARTSGLATISVILFSIVGLVLLIACANVAGLLLGRIEARRHEIAVRMAVGASRGRILRQLLVEALLLGAASGTAGCLLGWSVTRFLPSMLPPMPLPLGVVFELDARAVAFTLLLALGVAPVFSLVPAILASRGPALNGLDGRLLSPARGRRFAVRDALVIVQVALAAVLLLGAGLLTRSLLNLQRLDLGFDRRPGVVVMLAPQLPESREERLAFYHELVDRASALPAAAGATIASRLPLAMHGGGARQQVVIPGYQMEPGQDSLQVRFSIVDERYFEVLGTRVLRGRSFRRTDVQGPKLVVVSEAMARSYWPAGAVGQRIQVGAPGERDDYEVVGVAEDAKQNDPAEEPQPFLYFLRGQKDSGDLTLFVRSRGSEAATASQLKALLREAAPGMPTLRMGTLEEHLRAAVFATRVVAILATVLGAVGIALATIGLYGVVAYLVSRRTREIGVRMALGATPGRVLAGVLARALALAGAGLAIGLTAGVAFGGAARRMLFGVSTADPWMHAAVAVLVALVALAAAYLPARRAASLDPVRTLRTE